jgi:hypothetical protein
MGLSMNLITAVPLAALLMAVLPAFLPELVIGFLCALLFSVGTTATGLMVDVAHPKFGWKNETEAIKQNGMAALTMFGSMGFVAACGAATTGCIGWA